MDFEKLTIESARAFDARMKDLKRVYPDHYYDELEKKGYIKLTETLNGKNWYEKTFKANNYTFVTELEKYMLSKAENDTKNWEKEKLEIELAKSNLEANELNKSIVAKNEADKKRNKTERIINISLGVLNLVLLVVQILISLYKD